jgi:succinylglutamic semialdehyde dehydrogenase
MSELAFLGDYIHGTFKYDGLTPTHHSTNPSTGDLVCQFSARPTGVDEAIASAQQGLILWRTLTWQERADYLMSVAHLVDSHKESIAKAITLEMGKPISEARIEAGSIKGKIQGTIQNWSSFLPPAIDNAPGEQRFRGLGVVAVIGPFNFPVHLLNTHVIPALLNGNAVIIKPSEITPLSAQRYLELFHAAGFPAGVLNLVQGGGDVGAKLTAHDHINGVIFTGSYETGRKIRQATFDQPHKKVCLELGGKNPALVLDDANLDQATREILLGSLLTTGQRCTATSRVIATAGIAEALKHRLVDALKSIRPSDPLDDSCFMGPLSSFQAQTRFMDLLEQGQSEGAEPWVDSVAVDGGAFVTPSLYGVQGHERYLDEELFGPHISFQVVDTNQDVLAWAQKNQYGLSASVFTQSKETFEWFYDGLSTGILNWNRSTNGASGFLPFGGVGKSGNWHAGGSEGARLSSYPVAVMQLPYGQITQNTLLERQLTNQPLTFLEVRHRLEEVGERFKLWIEEKGIYLHLPFKQITVRDGGFRLTASVLRTQAQSCGLETDDDGVLFDLHHPSIDVIEDALIQWLTQLVLIDPEPFFLRPRRVISSPKDGHLPRSSAFLERFYGGHFVPREKKPAVVDLARSQGPFLRSIDDHPLQIIDAASQIASLPAGFRPDAVQKQLDEGDYNAYLTSSPLPGEIGSDVFEVFEKALLDHAPPTTHHVCWTNGGAESNEKAFHIAHLNGQGGKRVLAFEGAFHGRTLISLYCTWNPVKRIPYQIKGYEAVFLTRPLPDDPYFEPEIPQSWTSEWSTPCTADTDRQKLKGDGHDELLALEVDALMALEAELIKGDILGCIIEPYQCEGGDVSASNRFFHGLRALTHAYNAPLIFDEVQSGFGLSGEVFWHQNIKLVDAQGNPDGPDLVTGAKRAQVGYVLSRWPDPDPGPAHAASAVRGLAHLNLIQELPNHEALLRYELDELVSRWSKIVSRPRAFGDAFAFDLPSTEIALHLIGQRFYQGYMVYIAGKKTLRYRMNRGFRVKEIQEVFRVVERSLDALVEQAGGPGENLIERMSQCSPPSWKNTHEPDADYVLTLTEVLTVPGDADLFLKRYGELNAVRRIAGETCLGLTPNRSEVDLEILSEADPSQFQQETGYSLTHFIADRIGVRIRRIDLDEFDSLQDEVMTLEADTYEPERQDSFETLRSIVAHPEGMILIAEDLEGLAGMSFASPLEEWTHSDGPALDINQGKHNTLYGADTSVDLRVRGHGVGHRLRKASIKEALRATRADGRPRFAYITGRNRVGDANAMWTLNQNWGGYLVKYYTGQYGSENADARYYRIPLRRFDRRAFSHPVETTAQMWGVHQPTGQTHPLLQRAQNLGVFDEGVLTKMTVSNFITPPYARYAEALRMILPPGCAHMYFTSCPDEMIDKSIRSLKHNRAESQVVLSFEGAYLGGNTAAGRSLSDHSKYFPWPSIPHPDTVGIKETITLLNQAVKDAGGAQGVITLFVETIQSRTGRVLSDQMWDALCEWREATGIPLVLSETQTGMGRSLRGRWWLNGTENEADLVLWWGGGQIGHIFARPSVFVAKPLTLISTWDGDELSANRLLWQLYITHQLDLTDLADWLDVTLSTYFEADQVGGVGLYRTVISDQAHALQAALKEHGIQIQVSNQTLCFAPPLTLSKAEQTHFKKALVEVLV